MPTTYDAVIIGGGLSGLTCAHFLKKFQPDIDLVILEKNQRAGGAINSFHESGFLAEWGPHGFLDNTEESRELLDDTGLAQEAQRAELAKFVRYICLDGALRLIPQNPKKILASSLVSLPAKLRVLGDLFITPQPGEISVRQWVAHRFGTALLPFADAVFTGTYAGDFEKLSINATMPGIRGLELEHGSVIKGLLKKRKNKKKGTGLPAMLSFASGMGRLPEALAQGHDLRFAKGVDRIEKNQTGWQVMTTDEIFLARNVILALSLNQALGLLSRSGITPPEEEIPEARIANVVLGFHGDQTDIPFGFGYLAPEQEKRFALGALFSSHMFPGRAPAGQVLLEGLVGGRRHPERLDLSDDLLIQKTLADLRKLIRLPERPSFAKVLRPAQGIPQVETGLLRLLEWRHTVQQERVGLSICGFGWGGIGINDMIKEARQTAWTLCQNKTAAQEKAAVKGIYF